MRPIDADSLLDKVLRHYTEQEKKGNLSFVACEIKQSFADMVNEAPTIEPPHWIPVTERLPEDVYGKNREQIVVLVCTKSGKVSQCARMADYDCIADKTLTKVEWIKNGKFYWSKNKAVTHWMPMPEPPKEDEGESNGKV